jgi:hypothetical protein
MLGLKRGLHDVTISVRDGDQDDFVMLAEASPSPTRSQRRSSSWTWYNVAVLLVCVCAFSAVVFNSAVLVYAACKLLPFTERASHVLNGAEAFVRVVYDAGCVQGHLLSAADCLMLQQAL